ncbi:thioesterase family protein [Metallococcus carri]|uniref:thioesterase family protein n=1 Tax=Metallococcus carri TaxID=1656884 RepID=UPI002E2E11EC|nr:thioesterase family protein [Metallococcus carri]
MTDLPDSSAYYRRLGPHTYAPTINAQGAWRDTEQHMAPISGLITHELCTHEPREDMQIGRITFEILGIIPAVETSIEVTTVRPGRTIELLEATASAGGRPVIRARAWRLSRQDTTAYAGSELPAMDPPDAGRPVDTTSEWPGGFIRTLRTLELPGGRAGRRQVWVRSACTLLEQEPAAGLAAYVMLVDGANGIATRIRPSELMFPNVELSIHLLRQPAGPWLGLDTAVSFGPGGLGITSTTLNDEDGAFGRAEQELTVREFPS